MKKRYVFAIAAVLMAATGGSTAAQAGSSPTGPGTFCKVSSNCESWQKSCEGGGGHAKVVYDGGGLIAGQVCVG